MTDTDIIFAVIRFMETFVIECEPGMGCGRCDDARKHVKALYSLVEPEQDCDKNNEYIDESDKLGGE